MNEINKAFNTTCGVIIAIVIALCFCMWFSQFVTMRETVTVVTSTP